MSKPRGLEIHVSNPRDDPATYTYIPLSFQQATAAPISTEEIFYDDMGMAELSRQPKRMPRLLFRSSMGRGDQSSLSGPSGQTKQVYRSLLRRLTRRPTLNKTRSLVAVPSDIRSSNAYMMSGLTPPQALGEQAVFLDSDRGRSVPRVDAAISMAEREHHSEQPRAWIKPSATLWTLQEDEE